MLTSRKHIRWVQPLLVLVATVFSFFNAAHANDYTDAWAAMHKNDRAAARKLFSAALKDPKYSSDAYLSLCVLNLMESKNEEDAKLMEKALKTIDNKEPYLFALWYTPGLAGWSSDMNKKQLEMVENTANSPQTSVFLRQWANGRLGDYYQTQSDFEKRNEYWGKNSNLNKWQITGPFDNQSESGFDKNYPPITNPKPDAKFKSIYNSDIAWFMPVEQPSDNWWRPNLFLRYNTAIYYGQNFVQSETDQNAFLGVSYAGTGIKVWVNDRLVLSDKESRAAPFDLYKIPVKLQKGTNRILVQLGRVDGQVTRFNLQLLDEKDKLLTNVKSTGQYQPYTADKRPEQPEPQEFPFVQFFKTKVAAEPENSLYQYLLYLTYSHCGEYEKALGILNKVVEQHPKSSLFRNARRIVYSSLKNETEEAQERLFFINEDPESLLGCIFRAQEAYQREDWNESMKIVEFRAENYEDDEEVWQSRIQIVGKQNKMDDLLQLVEDGAKKFPKSRYFANLRYNVATKMDKNPKAGIKVYENLLEQYYTYDLASTLKDLYFEQGMEQKGVKILESFYEHFAADPTEAEALANYYYNKKDPAKAEPWIKKALAIAPYDPYFWQTAASIAQLEGADKKELEYLTKSLHYFPNSDKIRARIRELEGKKALYDYLPIAGENLDELIKSYQKKEFDEQYSFYYLLDDFASVVYPEKISEDFVTYVIKITNEKGVETWKETTVSYNGYSQRVVFDKTEVIKPDGARTEAERDDNNLVFTNLQIGDVIVLKYKIVNYISGDRMSREYTRTFGFNGEIPIEKSRFTLLYHKDVPFESLVTNGDIKPVVTDQGDYKRSVWETNAEPVVESESLMPPYIDAYKVVHISTIKDWNEVKRWYSDLSSSQAKPEYEVKEVLKELFPNGHDKVSETERAKIIYNYIVSTIKYSSVPFRQSGLIPQKSARVIQTKLGDCKDLSTLYATLAREVGLKANLVLVNTSDNGYKALMLPSIDFNHCIVKVNADQKDWYLELTDKYLPFGSLAHTDITSKVLEIPYKTEKENATDLFSLNPVNRTMNTRRQFGEVKVEKKDLVVTNRLVLEGALATAARYNYIDESRKDILESVQSDASRRFNNTVSVKEFTFGDLKELKDTLHLNLRFNVKNEVIQVGDMNTFKVPFYYTFVTPDAFPEQEEPRRFPLYFHLYDDADLYADEIVLTVPEGKQFSDVPSNVKYSFDQLTYSLEYVKVSPQKLKVVRTINIKTNEVAPARYEDLRSFVEQVVAAEQRYVVFK